MKCLLNNFYSPQIKDNIFAVFKSIDDILYLVYSELEEKKSIIFYNLTDEKKVLEIKNAHKEEILNYRNYYDNIKKRDLVISLSSKDINLWDINNFECILKIKNIYVHGDFSSACIINIKDQLYIIFSQYFGYYPIEVFDLNGNEVKELNDSNYRTVFVDTYYSKKSHKNYIISSILNDKKDSGIIKIYDFVSNSEYHKYYVEGYSSFYFSVVIYENDNCSKVLASNYDRTIRIWNFKTETLIKVISDNDFFVNCIYLWKNKYLLAASNKGITVIDIEKEKMIKNLYQNIQIDNIKMINHPIYGDCFIISNLTHKKIWILTSYFEI